MSQVSLTVGGRKYIVACAEGEEDRVSSLGAEIDGKLDQLGGNLAPQESQNLLFAALLLADELRETKLGLEAERGAFAKHKAESEESAANADSQRGELARKITGLESKLEGLQSAHQTVTAEADDLRAQLQQRTDEAEKLRDLAEKFAASLPDLQHERDAANAALATAKRAMVAAETSAFDARKELATSKEKSGDLNAAVDRLTADLSAAQEAAANIPPAGLADDPDLAPALERFAEMLENCADKLEGSAADA